MALGLNWNIDKAMKDLEVDANRTAGLSLDAIEDLGKKILKTAKDYCPVDKGSLKKSGKVRVRKGKTERRETVTITFGGKKAPYAVPVHYDPDLPLKSGKHRFLEVAVNEHAGPGKIEAVVSRKLNAR